MAFPCGPVDCCAPVCDPCCDRLPFARSVKARSSRGCGSKHEVNCGEARTVENKVDYKLPTCFGPVRISSARACRAERNQQVKSGQYGGCSNTVHHKVLGC